MTPAATDSEPWTAAAQGYLAVISSHCGAGIYEELLFRVILFSGLLGLFKLAGLTSGWRIAAAVAASSLLFAAAHYQFDFTVAGHHFASTVGDKFTWSSFLFRMSAGGFFSLLYCYRGFGVVVGTHALYDIFTLFA